MGQEFEQFLALHTPPETSSASLVMALRTDAGAVIKCTPLPNGILVPDCAPGVEWWESGREMVSYMYPAPEIGTVVESAWRHGAYDVRVIIDAPKDLRRSGSIVAFAGRPAIDVCHQGTIESIQVAVDWSHLQELDLDINRLIDVCSREGYYHFSWRPNYGEDKVLRSRSRGLGLDEHGYRVARLPELPALDQALQQAKRLAPADFVVRFSPPSVGRVEPIEWHESSHP